MCKTGSSIRDRTQTIKMEPEYRIKEVVHCRKVPKELETQSRLLFTKEIQSKICKIKTLTIKFLSTLKISSKLACNNLHFFKSQNSTMRVLSRIIVVFKEGN